MNTTPQDRAISGAANAPLTNTEKKRLATLCHNAWEKLGRPGESFDAWRHQQVMMCVERPGLRQCRHEDYGYIKAHMQRIMGQDAQAQRTVKRIDNQPQLQALAKLRYECRAAKYIEHPAEYVIAISKAKFKTGNIRSLEAKQIWQLIFSLRNGDQRAKRKGKQQNA